MQTLTGATHPLARACWDADQAYRARVDGAGTIARAILADHRRHSISDQTVYDVGPDSTPAWRRVGPLEHHGQAATSPGHITVTSRDVAGDVAARIVGPSRTRLHELRDAALTAAPMASVLLALRIDTGSLAWDTDETLAQAGLRLALEAGWCLQHEPNPARPTPRDIYADVARLIQMAPAGWDDAVDAARWWVDEHVDVTARLARLGVAWGVPALPAVAAAARAGVAQSTWSAHVTRGEAPAPDVTGPSGWLPATVDAWRLMRPRTTWLEWGTTPRS